MVPSVTNITSTTTDGTYTAGQEIPITVQFSEAVTVTGTPQLTLATGGSGTIVNYANGSGTNTLTFIYVVTDGDTWADLDYLSSTALTLNGGTIQDKAGNDADLTLAAPGTANSLGANKALVIDAVVPTVTGVTTSTPDGAYTVGQVIPITITFSEAVTVTGTPQLTLATGGAGKAIDYVSGSGTNTLTFNYTVAAGDSNTDLDYLSTAALTLNGGTIKDSAGNDANLTLATPGTANSLGANAEIAIDTAPLTVTINQDPGQSDPTASSTINFAVVFSKPVTDFDSSDVIISGTAGATTATVTPVDDTGKSYNVAITGMTTIGSVTASIKADAATDKAGNRSTISTSTDNQVKYDNTIPTVIGINRTDSMISNTSTVGYTVRFSEDVTGVDASDFTLTTTGSITGASITGVTPVNGSTYSISVNTGNGDGTLQLNLTDDDSIQNALGVPIGGTGLNNSDSSGQIYTLDKTVPTVSSISSPKPNGSYSVGQTIAITVSFNEIVKVTGTPKLNLNSGSSATYASGDGTDTLTFNYTVAAGESATNLDVASANALILNGGSIKDSANNNATLTLPTPGTANSLGTNKNIAIDTTVPTISRVTSTLADGSYTVGQVVPITVTFSEPVKVTGTPTLSLNSGVAAAYISGSGSNTLTFNYTVAAGQNVADLNYTTATALGLNGGTITDLAGNNSILTLAAPGALNSLGVNKDITVDTTAPTISNTTSTLTNGIYPLSQSIPIAVTFSEKVNVTGIPTLTLNNGGAATYASGNGTNTLTFNYTVATGQNIADLDYANANALSLNGGTIKDIPGNNAILTLATPGAPKSLGANKNIAIDTTLPTITDVTSALADGTYTVGQVIPITVTFTKPVKVRGTPTLALNSGGTATYASGSGSNTLTFNYTVADGQKTSDLDYASANALLLNGGAINDIPGNNATLTLPAPGAANSLGANRNIALFNFSDSTPTPITVKSGLSLDGVDDYVKVAKESTFDITNAITIEGWFKIDSWTKPWQAIITKGDSAWRIARAGEGNSLEFAIGAQSLYGNKAVNDGRWHHVAGVYDGSKMKLYIDGVLDNEKAASGPIPTNNYDVWIGANAEQPNRNFAGQLDELRVWNVARSQNDITTNMGGTIDVNTPGLLGYWKFDEGTGTTTVDAAGNDNNGTLITGTGNTPSWDTSTPVTSVEDAPDDNDQKLKFATWQQLESFLNVLYKGTNGLSARTKQSLKAMFDVFESGETNPTTTITASAELSPNSIELTADRDSIRIDLASLLRVIALFNNIPIPIPDALSQYGITLPLKETTLSISKLKEAPIYELSTKVLSKDEDEDKPESGKPEEPSALDLIQDFLGIDELTLKAEVNSAAIGPSVTLTGELEVDKTIFEVAGFELDFVGGELSMGVEMGEPNVSITPKLKLKNYDPTQDNEPDLTLSGTITLEPESFSAGFELKTEEDQRWKDPFGLPDSEFRDVVFEAGGSYLPPYFDNFKILGDLKFGNYDIKAGLAVDDNDANKNAVLLTVYQPLSLVDLYAGPVRAFLLKQIADRVQFVQDGLNFLNRILDLTIRSIDSDHDGKADPLVSAALFPTSIGEEKIQPGLSINGALNAWGKEATLVLGGNPFNPGNPNLSGALTLPSIDWGFFKLTGVGQPNLNIAFEVSPQKQFFGANGKLDIFGYNVGTIDCYFDRSQININQFRLGLGVLELELNGFKFDTNRFTGAGSGFINLFGQRIATGSFNLGGGDFSAAGRLGINVLGYDFGVNVLLKLGKSGNYIRLDTSAFDRSYTLVNESLDPFVNAYKSLGSIEALIRQKYPDLDRLISAAKTVYDTGKSIIKKVWPWDGYITNATVFFDANFNGVIDDNEPFTVSNADGSFNLNLDLTKFDINKNNQIDSNEGRYVVTGGTDSSTMLPLEIPLSAVVTPTTEVVSPLTTIIAELAQQGLDPVTAQTQIKAALGLAVNIDLASFDPLQAIPKGDNNGISVFASAVMIQNTIVQTAKFIYGASTTLLLREIANGSIAAIANQLKAGIPVNLGKVETIQAIVQNAIAKIAASDPSIKPSQLSAAAAAAAQVIATGNQMIQEVSASGRPSQEIALEITRLQAVSIGQVAVDLPDLAAGKITVKEFLAEYTREAILQRAAKVQVNDPTVRPGVEENPLNSRNDSPPAITSKTLIGTNRNDTLIGDAGDDVLFGKKGNDFLQGNDGNDFLAGGKGNDRLKGNKGNDTLQGNQGNDKLWGGEGSDVLTGNAGNDLLVGVNPKSAKPGIAEVDRLTGGSGNDVFVLGDRVRCYYDDHKRAGTGTKDYALIVDFNPRRDTIQLHGSIAEYALKTTTGSLPKGTALFHQSELIAIIQRATKLDLESSYFRTQV